MTNKLILFFILSSFFGYSQQNWLELSSETLSINKVKKVVEYDALDSTDFFLKYPNGFYYRFDSDGNLIERNGYSPYETDSNFYNGEFISFYNYDSVGNQVAYVLIDRSWKNPIWRVQLDKQIGADSTSSVYYDGLRYEHFSTRTNIVKREKLDLFDTIYVTPSLIKTTYKKDTNLTSYIYKNQFNTVDSIIEYQSCSSYGRKFPCYKKTVFEYYEKSSNQVSKKSVFDFDKRRQLFQPSSTKEYFYQKNGLIDKYKGHYNSNGKSFEHKFKYYFRIK